MRIISFGIIFIVALSASALAWTTIVTVDAGHPRELTVGIEPGATDGFDRDIDLAAPPLPPVGFYCFFPFSDTAYEYLSALWSDIRGPGGSAEWEIRLNRPDKPPQITFSNLPKVGMLRINNVDAVSESLALTFSRSDSVLKLEYVRGFWEEAISTIDFEVPEPVDAIIVIKTANGEPIRRLPDMFLNSGIQSIGWNATDNRGNPVEPGLYYARISLRFGMESSDFEVETIVRSNGNKLE